MILTSDFWMYFCWFYIYTQSRFQESVAATLHNSIVFDHHRWDDNYD